MIGFNFGILLAWLLGALLLLLTLMLLCCLYGVNRLCTKGKEGEEERKRDRERKEGREGERNDIIGIKM